MATGNKPARAQELAELTPEQVSLIETLGIQFQDSSEAAMDIAFNLANASTPEALLGESAGDAWGEFMGIPVYVKSVKFMRSALGGGAGFFAAVNAVTADTEEPLRLTTGSVNVLIQLARMSQMGWLDRPVKMTQSQSPSANGYFPQRLALAGD